jgi:hypothetical protein
MKSEKQLNNELKKFESRSGRAGRIAKKGLEYAEYFEGAEKRDILRYYIKEAKTAEKPNSRIDMDYEGSVLDRNHIDPSGQYYTIIDSTSIQSDKVEAGLIDVTRIEAESIRCTVLDGTSVIADTLDVQVSDYTSYETLEEKKEEERKQKRRLQKRKEAAQENLSTIENQLKDKKEKKVARQILEKSSPEEQEELKDLLSSDKSPYRVLKRTAQALKSQYERPPNSDGDMIDINGSDMIVSVSQQPIVNRGNNVHSGKWVIIEYRNRTNEFVVLYKRHGISGSSDKRSSFSMEEITSDKLESQVQEYLPTYSQ